MHEAASGNLRYPEKRLQQQSVSNLIATKGYQESLEDSEATGDRVDSAGLINGRLWLIEYKVNVTGPMVRHSPSRPSTIESKIAGALRSIYNRESNRLAWASNAVWDRTSKPIVSVIARSFSATAREEFARLFDERGDYWHFDLVVLAWNGKEHESVFEGQSADATPEDYDHSQIESLIGRQSRASNMTFGSALIRAGSLDLQDVFAAFIEMGKTKGVRWKFGRNSISGAIKRDRFQTILGCYFDGSTAKDGLLIGLDRPAFGSGVEHLGRPAAPEGYLNFNRYLGAVSDIAKLYNELRID